MVWASAILPDKHKLILKDLCNKYTNKALTSENLNQQNDLITLVKFCEYDEYLYYTWHWTRSTSLSPESTSSSLISILPSRRSTYKSWILQPTLDRWEFTHFVNVFFCTLSRSSANSTIIIKLFSRHWKIPWYCPGPPRLLTPTCCSTLPGVFQSHAC